ncbi:MAG: DJ-1/PfpI family protein [Bacteroidota bacterium]
MQIIIYIYEGMTMLDAIGPYEVLRNMDGAEIKFVAKQRGEITADSQMIHINAKHSIEEIKSADILLIPGSTVGFIREMKDKKVLNWIRAINETTQKTVSVCTGSIILAATGLLEGKKATSHWKPIDLLTKFKAIPTRERIVEEGKFITAAGVSAGIDMAIYLVNQLKGELVAKASQLAIEYDPAPMFQSGNIEAASPEVIEWAEKTMEKGARKELSVLDILKHGNTLRKMK